MSVTELLPAPAKTSTVPALPGIGVGAVFHPTPSVDVSRLSRYRMRANRPGLNLSSGELVLCAPYEPSELGMVVLVRCEADGHSPGALLSAREVEHLEPVLDALSPRRWDEPGTRFDGSSPQGQGVIDPALLGDR